MRWPEDSRVTRLTTYLLVTVVVGCTFLANGTAASAAQKPASLGNGKARVLSPSSSAANLCASVGFKAGFDATGNLVTAVAVGLAESGCNPSARGTNPPTSGCPNGSVDRGLWQINNCYHPEISDACAYDAQCNANAAYTISSAGTNWTPWSTYTSGAYRTYLSQAQTAVNLLFGRQVTVARHPNGVRIDLFMVGTDGSAQHAHMDDGATLSGWESLSGSPLGPPNASWTADGSELDAFAIGADHYVYEDTLKAGSWNGWHITQGHDLPRPIEEATVARDPYGRLDLFLVGLDGAAWHEFTYNNGATWSLPESLGGSPLGAPTGSWSGNGAELDVIAVGQNHGLYQDRYDPIQSKWSGWYPIQGSTGVAGTEMVGLARHPNGVRLDIVLRGGDGAAWHEWIDSNGMSPPETLRGTPLGAPTASWTGDGTTLNVFALGSDRHPYEKSFSGSWGGWQRLDGLTG
jgi:hypothetical protein